MEDFEKSQRKLLRMMMIAGTVAVTCLALCVGIIVYSVSQIDGKEVAREMGEMSREYEDAANGG